MAQMKQKKSTATVSSIQTDYVRMQQQKVDRKNAQKVRLYRRLTVFVIIAVIIFGGLTFKFMDQKQLLAQKVQAKEVLLVQLEEAENEKKILTRQIAKLNDDEYIAKLARQEYFLSDKNEIIFSIPQKNDSNKKKVDKKE